MNKTDRILEKAAQKLAEATRLLNKVEGDIKVDSVKLLELSKELVVAERRLRQQNIDFMSMLVDAGSQLTGSNNFKVAIYPEDHEKKYWVFKKGKKVIIYSPTHKTKNFGYDLSGCFGQMRSRVTDEVCELLKAKSKHIAEETKDLANDTKKSSEVPQPKK